MKSIELKFFIDTTVAVSAITGRNTDAWVLLESGKRKVVSLYVNDFVIKETRWTLEVLDISQENINYAVNYILECCIVRKNVPKKEFSRFRIRDKNDIPILAGAVKESAVLVTEDNLLKDDSKGYAESVTPEEALRKIK
ncbi:Uncharacterised protein [uncultured archaeon]|nr:Uncharacterised protein [uncultured archaeon]